MNTAQLKGKWDEVKGHLTKKYGQFTNDELTRAKGDIQQLIGIVQDKTGKAREEIEKYLDQAFESASSTVSRLASMATDYASEASDYVNSGYEQATEAAQYGYDQTRQMVQRSPMESVAVAFGVGVLAGVLCTLSMVKSSRS